MQIESNFQTIVAAVSIPVVLISLGWLTKTIRRRRRYLQVYNDDDMEPIDDRVQQDAFLGALDMQAEDFRFLEFLLEDDDPPPPIVLITPAEEGEH